MPGFHVQVNPAHGFEFAEGFAKDSRCVLTFRFRSTPEFLVRLVSRCFSGVLLVALISPLTANAFLRRGTSRAQLINTTRGHVLLCLSGELLTELEDGRTFTLKPGMSNQVADNAEPHRSSTAIGAELFIID